MKKFLAGVVAIILSLALSGCSDSAPKAWVAGTGEIKIVATTNVWASIAAEALGQDLVTSNALIYNINQDPHSFEASARDQLLINEADIVVMNGGGYDDFMTTLVAAAENKPQLINAVETVGTREDGNEHIWLDIDRVRLFGETLNAEVAKLHPELATQLTENLQKFDTGLATLSAAEVDLKSRATGTKVVQTESLLSYLLEDTGFIDATPAEMAEAVEEERDIPPLAMQAVQKLINAGEVKAILAPFGGHYEDFPQWTGRFATLGFYEILSMDPDTFEQYDRNYFEYMQSCIQTLGVALEE